MLESGVVGGWGGRGANSGMEKVGGRVGGDKSLGREGREGEGGQAGRGSGGNWKSGWEGGGKGG